MTELPHNLLLYGLLLIAVAAGFLLGRRERKRKAKPRNIVLKDYYQGLNFLLSERPELGVDQFIRSTEVADDTVDVHLAMASVVRRRGETDKAIRIHQNLLASPVLNKANKQLIELELARDYQMAGLLDRAESLLQQIVERRGLQEKAALELLLDLYEQQRDWLQAIDISPRLLRLEDNNNSQKARISHFYCEQAEQLLTQEAEQPASLKMAAKLARRAGELAPDEVRSVWLGAQILFAQQKYKQVLRQIHKASQQRPDLVPVFLPLYEQACMAVADARSYTRFLHDSLNRLPHPAVMRALVNHQHSLGQSVDAQALVQQISQAPQAAHLPLLLDIAMGREGHGVLYEAPALELGYQGDMPIEDVPVAPPPLQSQATVPDETLAQARAQIDRIVVGAEQYRCSNCGFTAQQMMWQCPTCRQWGTFRLQTGSAAN